MRRPTLVLSAVPLAALLAVSLTGCGSSSGGSGSSGSASQLRLGYFANLTHSPALVGVANGDFTKALGSTTLKTQVFNAGPAEITALEGGSLDAAFVGPSPAINAFVTSKGQALRIVSGAAVGGAELVVKPSITSAAQLTGTKIADPQLGNTQDVALRTWLNDNGHHVTLTGGDVTIVSEDNSTTVTAFQQGQIQGAWLPEPYASQLVAAGGHVLVNEKSLWPNGKFATTELVVTTDYLKAHPAQVKALITGEVAAIDSLTSDPGTAKTTINAALTKLAGKPLASAVLDRAFGQVTPTDDPAAGSLQTDADHAFAAGTLKTKADLKGLVDLTLLNQVLQSQGKPAVSDGGLS